MYGRLVDGRMEYAPKNVVYDRKYICNPKEDILLKLGYLPIVRTEQPMKEGYFSNLYWEQEENRIVEKWKLEKINMEITTEERLTVLEDAFLEFVSEVMSGD